MTYLIEININNAWMKWIWLKLEELWNSDQNRSFHLWRLSGGRIGIWEYWFICGSFYYDTFDTEYRSQEWSHRFQEPLSSDSCILKLKEIYVAQHLKLHLSNQVNEKLTYNVFFETCGIIRTIRYQLVNAPISNQYNIWYSEISTNTIMIETCKVNSYQD